MALFPNLAPSTSTLAPSPTLALLIVSAIFIQQAFIPRIHSLFVSSITWLLVYIYTMSRGPQGSRGVLGELLASVKSVQSSWAVGRKETLLLSASILLSRVTEHAGGPNAAWSKALLPLIVPILRQSPHLMHTGTEMAPLGLDSSDTTADDPQGVLLWGAIASMVAMAPPFITSSNISLALSNAVFMSASLVLLERLISSDRAVRSDGIYIILRQISTLLAPAFALLSLLIEGTSYSWIVLYPPGGLWPSIHAVVQVGLLVRMFLMCALHAFQWIFLLSLISKFGALSAAFVELSGSLTVIALSFNGFLQFGMSIVGLISVPFYYRFPSLRTQNRFRPILNKAGILLPGLICLVYLASILHFGSNSSGSIDSPPALTGNFKGHPITSLVHDAEVNFANVLQRQSKSLPEAVTEYQRRYGTDPPPNFDKWYEFAKERKSVLIDEYDTVFQMIKPFWGVKARTLRERVRETLAHDNAMMGLSIRDGDIADLNGGDGWQQAATKGMMEKFKHLLPDLDIAFNIHDEPRVVVPHSDLAKLLQRARLPSPGKKRLKNAWGRREREKIGVTPLTRFNVFAHQYTWTHSRLSCPPNSAARQLEDDKAADESAKYAKQPLGFIFNHTAQTDVCLSPSLEHRHGFFDRPNAYDVVQYLFPVFSQSKVSTYNDILYPSPWYWADKVEYKASVDIPWAEKTDKLLWRGSTTGGFSRGGGWKNQHRQRIVNIINHVDKCKVLQNTGKSAKDASYIVVEKDRKDFEDLFDVKFSHVGQCDPEDCNAQRELFEVVKGLEFPDFLKSKYLLDLDGNAFSGRFYAFLMSNSAVFKMAIFREWHDEWLYPWVHYVPLNLEGAEITEIMRWVTTTSEGKVAIRAIADRSRDWARKILRHDDFEVWFFRLLLEYGRVLDDERDNIGFNI